jgi:hypothetical protein
VADPDSALALLAAHTAFLASRGALGDQYSQRTIIVLGIFLVLLMALFEIENYWEIKIKHRNFL